MIGFESYSKEARILEIGGGAGRMNYLMHRGLNVIDFDISRSLIEKGNALYPDMTFFFASGSEILFKESSFDVILSFDVLEHLPDAEKHILRKKLAAHGFEYGFVKKPVVNEFIEQKIENFFGSFGFYLLRIINHGSLPIPMRTNSYVKGEKKWKK